MNGTPRCAGLHMTCDFVRMGSGQLCFEPHMQASSVAACMCVEELAVFWGLEIPN